MQRRIIVFLGTVRNSLKSDYPAASGVARYRRIPRRRLSSPPLALSPSHLPPILRSRMATRDSALVAVLVFREPSLCAVYVMSCAALGEHIRAARERGLKTILVEMSQPLTPLAESRVKGGGWWVD